EDWAGADRGVNHSGDFEIEPENRGAGDLGRVLDPRQRFTEKAPLALRPQPRVRRRLLLRSRLHHLTELQTPTRRAMDDPAVLRIAACRINSPLLGGRGDQHLPRTRAHGAQEVEERGGALAVASELPVPRGISVSRVRG